MLDSEVSGLWHVSCQLQYILKFLKEKYIMGYKPLQITEVGYHRMPDSRQGSRKQVSCVFSLRHLVGHWYRKLDKMGPVPDPVGLYAQWVACWELMGHKAPQKAPHRVSPAMR